MCAERVVYLLLELSLSLLFAHLEEHCFDEEFDVFLLKLFYV